jgi:hypothetical protein
MKFAIVPVAALATVALAAPAPGTSGTPTTASDACVTSAVSALGAIQTQMSNLNSETESFQPTFLLDLGPLLTLQSNADNLKKQVDSTTSLINSCGDFSEAQTLTIASPVLSIVPLINTTLDTFIAKKPAFDQSILDLISASWLVEIDLKNLKSSTDSLVTALENTFSSSFTTIVQSQGADIDTWFTNAINVFSKNNIIA